MRGDRVDAGNWRSRRKDRSRRVRSECGRQARRNRGKAHAELRNHHSHAGRIHARDQGPQIGAMETGGVCNRHSRRGSMSSASGEAGKEIASDPAVAAAEAVALGDRRRNASMSLAMSVLAAIALVAALYLARAFFVPLLIGILGSYALRPVVDWLEAHYIPRAAGAALVLIALVGGLSWVGYALRDDAAAMIEKLPQAARKFRQTMTDARAGGKTPLQNMQEAANEIQAAANDAGLKPGARAGTARAPAPRAWFREYV